MKKTKLYLMFTLIIILASLLFFIMFSYLQAPQPQIPAQLQHLTKNPLPKELSEANDTKEEIPTEEIPTMLGIPIGNSVRLSITQRVQETSYFCVPACTQMILHLFSINTTQTELAQQMKTDPITGTEYADLAITLNGYLFSKGLAADNEAGYHIQTMIPGDVSATTSALFEQRVREDIDTGYPVLTALNLNTLYPQLPVANHMLLITGYVLHKDYDHVAFYYGVDPYTLVQEEPYGGLKIFTPQEVMDAMSTNEEPAYLW